MGKPKLHEVLAVEADLDGAQKRAVEEATNTFTKKAEHFVSFTRQLKMVAADRAHEEVSETKEMVTTVSDKLAYVTNLVRRYYDCLFTKEKTNQLATADLMIENEKGELVTLISACPATFLLGLENRLKNLREMYAVIPTLQPGASWVLDPDRGKYVWRVKDPERQSKAQKAVKHKVLYEATKEHPAQIEKWTEEEVVGWFEISQWSGMLTVKDKAVLLERLDKLIRATKKARQRANSQEVTNEKVAKNLFDYLHAGIV